RKGCELHRYRKAVRDPSDLLPDGRCKTRECAFLGLKIEPPGKSNRLATQEGPAFRRLREDVRLRTPDLIGRAAHLNDADAKRLDRGLPVKRNPIRRESILRGILPLRARNCI